jgi:hypothetical protein
MEPVWFTLRQILVARLRGLNWPLVVVVAGFILLIPLYTLWIAPLSWLVRRLNPAPFASYQAAVRDAAIKTPEHKRGVTLATIDLDGAEVSVTAFKSRPPQSPLDSELWVSLPSQLKQACAGATEAARTLRQILGLPPTSEPRLVYEMTVKTTDIFRPCISERSPAALSCSMDPPKEPQVAAANKVSTLSADDLRKDFATLRQAYDDLRVVAGQMWTSYQIGFPLEHPVKPGDYPNKGFPFTGMGWTYDWRPSSVTHVGVTEFIVRKGAAISVEHAVDPETFCATER